MKPCVDIIAMRICHFISDEFSILLGCGKPWPRETWQQNKISPHFQMLF